MASLNPWGRKKVSEPADPFLDSTLEVNGSLQTYRDLRWNAEDIAQKNWTTPVEKGLALVVVQLVDELSKKAKTE